MPGPQNMKIDMTGFLDQEFSEKIRHIAIAAVQYNSANKSITRQMENTKGRGTVLRKDRNT